MTASAITYLVGMLGVTIGGNIPLNNALERFELDSADEASLRERRAGYESQWNRWHYVRSGAGTIAFGLAAIAALDSGD